MSTKNKIRERIINLKEELKNTSRFKKKNALFEILVISITPDEPNP